MMTQSEILECLRSIVGQVVGNDEVVLHNNTTADDVPNWDSFNHINIIVGVETKFGIKFNASEIEEMKNVGDFVTHIEKRLSKKK
jgi:acyl carrier protein